MDPTMGCSQPDLCAQLDTSGACEHGGVCQIKMSVATSYI